MGFAQTLRMVQLARAVTIVFTCISVSIFAYLMDVRYSARKDFAQGIITTVPSLFENEVPARSTMGGLALAGLALSLIWDGLCLFDLCVLKHYRFDRRVCIFVDITTAIVLIITGSVNFAYDAILSSLGVLIEGHMKIEIPAITLLGIVSLIHLGFFCYGCKDPAASALEFEHVPLTTASPTMPDYEPRSMRSRGSTLESRSEGLVHIELGKKVSILKLPIKINTEPVKTPPRTPREENEHKRLGFVGPPTHISNMTPKQSKSASPEGSPFLKEHNDSDWI